MFLINIQTCNTSFDESPRS